MFAQSIQNPLSKALDEGTNFSLLAQGPSGGGKSTLLFGKRNESLAGKQLTGILGEVVGCIYAVGDVTRVNLEVS